jgi:hypothetical protein
MYYEVSYLPESNEAKAQYLLSFAGFDLRVQRFYTESYTVLSDCFGACTG